MAAANPSSKDHETDARDELSDAVSVADSARHQIHMGNSEGWAGLLAAYGEAKVASAHAEDALRGAKGERREKLEALRDEASRLEHDLYMALALRLTAGFWARLTGG